MASSSPFLSNEPITAISVFPVPEAGCLKRCGVQPARTGVFLSYWLNAANSGPTPWKCGVVRGLHRCPKIPALDFRTSTGTS
jgi:hypothetical protein